MCAVSYPCTAHCCCCVCSADYRNLVGVNAWVSVNTPVNGQAPVGGSYQLKFRGQGPSKSIPYNADINIVTNALESIVTVDDVDVSPGLKCALAVC